MTTKDYGQTIDRVSRQTTTTTTLTADVKREVCADGRRSEGGAGGGAGDLLGVVPSRGREAGGVEGRGAAGPLEEGRWGYARGVD